MRKFTADFETTTVPFDCRVWAFAICEIGNVDNFIYGNNIEDFIKFCQDKNENYQIYFHNLKFDGEFIFSYLLNNGYQVIKSKDERKDKTFTCLISDTGQFYSIEIYFEIIDDKHINKVTIYDSLKILNFSVDKIAKDFNLPIQKLELDYNEKRKINHELTNKEINYIKNDVEIMARALEFLFNENLTKMTIGSDALYNYKEMNKNFNKYFPLLNYKIDQDIRKSYKGGFTYLNEIYKEIEVNDGLVLDVNSLYPSVMKNERLPFGEPIFFDGKYENDKLYNLYIQTISCSFEIKNGKIPCIQIKNNLSFLPNEYVKTSNGDIITLTLTNIDLELFLENYDVYDLIYHSGWKFKSIKGLFSNYIDFWSNRKINAKKEKNNVLYIISKLMLNSLYGKFGLNPNVQFKFPYLNEDGIVKYKMSDKEIRNSIYIPVASFISSYARNKTIRTSQKIKDYTIKNYNKDYYLYSDTDSIHLLKIDEEILKTFVDIDDFKLGFWKIESKFKKAKFIRQKCYIELNYDENLNVTIAGLPKKLGKYVSFDNFKIGMSILASDPEKEHKLRFNHVKGGIILTDTDFSIK